MIPNIRVKRLISEYVFIIYLSGVIINTFFNKLSQIRKFDVLKLHSFWDRGSSS